MPTSDAARRGGWHLHCSSEWQLRSVATLAGRQTISPTRRGPRVPDRHVRGGPARTLHACCTHLSGACTMIRTLFRLVVLVVLVIGLAAFFFGYRWGSPEESPRPAATSGQTHSIDAAKAREV